MNVVLCVAYHYLYTAKVINIFRHGVMNSGFFHVFPLFSEFKAHESRDFSFLFRRGRKYRSYARIKNQGLP